MEFIIKWNNKALARVIRDTDGVITILVNKSRFMFHRNDLTMREQFLGVLNVLTYGRSRGGWDLHLPDAEVLTAIEMVDVIHVVTSYVPMN